MKRLVTYARAGAELLRTSPVARLRAEIALAVCFVACGRASPTANVPDTSPGLPRGTLASDAGLERAPELVELWKRAAEGVEEDLMRLGQTEGAAGLAEGATTPATRLLAARAMPHSHGLAGLAWLGERAATDDVEIAREAAHSAVAIAARGRDQLDPEDAEEMRAGCKYLLAAARDERRDREVRIDAVRAVRLLLDRGCAKNEEVPTALDLKQTSSP